MRIQRIHVQNYRSLRDLEVEFDDVTVLLGTNGVGKSSILYALDWFFNGGDLEDEDFSYDSDGGTISVEVTFDDLSQRDRDGLEKYGTRETATFKRTWDPTAGEKLTGYARAFHPFEQVRAGKTATEVRELYKELRQKSPELGLPQDRSRDQVFHEMEKWEQENPNMLAEATISATHLFGFAGTAKLAGIFGYVLVRAHNDAEGETEDARGTLLAQLIERASSSIELEVEINELKDNFEEELKQLLGGKYEPILRSVENAVSKSLQQYVSGGDINLDVGTTDIRVPQRKVLLKASDGDYETDIGRQGQGFQRALLIAVLQVLAGIDVEQGESSLLIAIEEPELYQHPTQARHFASVLRTLAEDGNQRVQVAYATHSPYFVDPGAFEGLRRISKAEGSDGVLTTKCTQASFEVVRDRLNDAGIDGIPYISKARTTLRRYLNEAIFAKAVLLVEGGSDAGILRGAASRVGGFDSMGVACAPLGGKPELPMAISVLQSLGIPTFAVFDADGNHKRHLEENSGTGKSNRENADKARFYNNAILRMCNGQSEDWPNDLLSENVACFEFNLDAYLDGEWPELMQFVHAEKSKTGTKSDKPEGIYEHAAETVGSVPPLIDGIVKAAIALANVSR
ncbi:MAG: ATP-dependent endonuclease [bacterium]|nr:ATP-dependent endonuclease [bacterium]